MNHLQAQLATLHKNLNTLREREAKHGGRDSVPLELLNQIDDHQTAVALTEQALSGVLSEAECRAALEPLLVAINTRLGEAAVSRVTIGNVSGSIHDSIIAGGDVSITNIYQSGQAKPKQADRPPFMVEDLPPDFVPRPAELEPLLAHLLGGAGGGTVALTTALRGAGGYGKTTLAKAVCHEAPIKQAFADGILWVTLGERGEVLAGLTKLYAALTGERPNFVDLEDAATSLAQAWGNRHCLLVIDDVWHSSHLHPFLRSGAHCTRLITTRNNNTLPVGTQPVNVDAMQQTEAVALLGAGLPNEIVGAGLVPAPLMAGTRPAPTETSLRQLAARLGEWPLLLKLTNGVLRHRVTEQGQNLTEALNYVNRALDKRG